MNEKLIREKLEKVTSLIGECLTELGVKAGSPVVLKKIENDKPKSLNQHIMDLRDAGFFKEPKTVKEVHAKLQSVYYCAVKPVGVELIRIHDKKHLRKMKVKGGVAYVR